MRHLAREGAGDERSRRLCLQLRIAEYIVVAHRLGVDAEVPFEGGVDGDGLALARRLVELQSGQIGVVSEPGEGATFWVTLPGA